MRKLLSIGILSLFITIGCQNVSESQAKGGAIKSTIQVEEYAAKLAAMHGAQLVDVRTPGEYLEGHLQNAVNYNINADDFAEKVGKLDKSKPVFVYCLAGGRSADAANKLAEMGFKEVYNMAGGIMKWEGAGKPLEKGVGTPKKVGMTVDEFNGHVNTSAYVLVDYNAQWCAPCKKMMPILEALAEKKKDKLSLFTIDADVNKDLLQQKGITDIPRLELYQNGKLLWKHDGFIDEAQLLNETSL